MGRNVFRKHLIVLRLLGILLPGDLQSYRVLRIIVQIWYYYMAVLFPILTLGFLVGVMAQHREYVITATLYSIAGVISSACVGMKFLTVSHHRADIAELINFLKNAHADTRLGRLTYWLSVVYEGLAVGLRLVVLSDVIAKRKLKLIMPFWTPYSREDPTVAVATYVFVQGSAIIKTLTNFFIDTLFLMMANQTCHRLLVLGNTFRLIGLPQHEKTARLAGRHVLKLPPEFDLSDESLLRHCVQEQIALIRAVEKFGTILNKLFLPQVTNSFLSICIVMFSCTQAESMAGEVMKVAPWTTVICLQLFVSCFSGELIKSRCHDIFVSSYSSDWTGCSPGVRSSLLVVQTYTTRPKVLRGAYVFELSLHTFETAVREIFSTFTVVYQLFNTK